MRKKFLQISLITQLLFWAFFFWLFFDGSGWILLYGTVQGGRMSKPHLVCREWDSTGRESEESEGCPAELDALLACVILPLHSWPVTFFIVWNVYLAPTMNCNSTKANEFCKMKWAGRKISLKIMAIYIPNHSNTHLKQRMYPAYGFIWCFSVQS